MQPLIHEWEEERHCHAKAESVKDPMSETLTNTMKTPLPGFMTLLARGFRRTCPRCGETRLFDGFLKLNISCRACGQALGHIRADDFPPYLTMIIVGHMVVPLILLAEKTLHPSITLHLTVWLPVTLAMTLWLLPRIKGLIVGWMLHLGLRGDETQ